MSTHAPWRVMSVFGTRPEVIKLAPVIRSMEARPTLFQSVNVASGQHADLVAPFARDLAVRIDADLGVASAGQAPLDVCQRVLASLRPVLERERPDLLLVQGDTATTLASALAGFYARVPVGHVEAGLRSGRMDNPFPEEMHRCLVSRLASLHFAATERNVATLRAEGIAREQIWLTGNPVVDAVSWALERNEPSTALGSLLDSLDGSRLVVLTTHRRESFGAVMQERFRVLRRFVDQRPDTTLVFPVHPNPEVSVPARRMLAGAKRIHLIAPLGYFDFLHLLMRAWLIVTDSGGVQEEAPSLGKPVLVIRETTERPEAIEAGVAHLVGGSNELLKAELEACHAHPEDWIEKVGITDNPFGRGDSGERIADAIQSHLETGPRARTPAVNEA